MSDLLDMLLFFARLSLVAFGGGIGILPEMERHVVAAGWVTHQEFVDAYALSQVTPGPGMLMVVMIGYRGAGPLGALFAAIGMFGPAAAITWGIADRWSRFGERPLVVLFRQTLSPVALGLIAAGTYTLVRLAIHGPIEACLAATGLVIVAGLNRSPVFAVAIGAVAGLALLR